MRISYSGIDLEVIHLVEFERVPVLSEDSVDYLFTKFTVKAVGLVSSDQVIFALRNQADDTIGMSFDRDVAEILSNRPAVGAATLAGAIAANPGRPSTVFHTSDSTPIITDIAIRHWLSVPRRRLLITNESGALGAGGVIGGGLTVPPLTLISSPKPGSTVDAHNGPFVDVFSVQQAFGDANLFMVSLQVTTYVNECEENTGILGAFLSNRFAQTHDINEDGFIIIQTEGQARFRTDLVYDILNPDTLRSLLFLPIPNGFKRQNIRVSAISDASGFNYAFIDEQLPQQLVVGDEINATRVEATYTQTIVQEKDAFKNTVEGALETRTSANKLKALVKAKWKGKP